MGARRDGIFWIRPVVESAGSTVAVSDADGGRDTRQPGRSGQCQLGGNSGPSDDRRHRSDTGDAVHRTRPDGGTIGADQCRLGGPVGSTAGVWGGSSPGRGRGPCRANGASRACYPDVTAARRPYNAGIRGNHSVLLG